MKRTITEVRVASILKFDRSVRTGDQPDKSASEQGVPFQAPLIPEGTTGGAGRA